MPSCNSSPHVLLFGHLPLCHAEKLWHEFCPYNFPALCQAAVMGRTNTLATHFGHEFFNRQHASLCRLSVRVMLLNTTETPLWTGKDALSRHASANGNSNCLLTFLPLTHSISIRDWKRLYCTVCAPESHKTNRSNALMITVVGYRKMMTGG